MRIKITLLLILLVSFNTQAFKINTHSFIGQEVINDIKDDGEITIPYKDSYISIPISTEVKEAILSFPQYYLMGTIGPDATPDVVVGQSIIHPGSEGVTGRWEVSDWLHYLSESITLDARGKAFYFGYLSHVASDVFAHTYVNQYAGDVFSLADNETLVERRHIALEAFIDARTPDFKNEKGEVISKTASGLITLDDKYGEMIRDYLVYNDQVYSQFKMGAYANHLIGYKSLRDEVDAIANNNIWHEIDKEVLKFISKNYYNYDMSDDEADKLLKGFQPINEILNGDIPDYLQSFENKTYQNLKKWEELGFNTLVSKIRYVQSLEQRIREKKTNN